MKLARTWSVLCAIALGSGAASALEPPQVFENVQFSQSVDLTGTYVKKSIRLDVINVGSKDATEYFFAMNSDEAAHLAIMEVQQEGIPLPIDLNATQSDGVIYHRIQLAKALAPGDSSKIIIAQAVTNQFIPVPEFGAQSDEQFLVYHGAKVPFSAYKTKEANLRIRHLGLKLEESNESGEPPKEEQNMLIYGPFKNVKPHTESPLQLRYLNPKSQVKFTHLKRDAWVSHWGSALSFEETYWLKNVGTKLKEQFSRVDLSRGGSFNLNVASIRELIFNLPGNAREDYHVDLVGIVSTSKLHSNKRESSLTVRPRYPVFGGWKYNFTIGWSHDLAEFVREIGEREYLIRVPLINGPEQVSYDDVELNVILPEGADDINVLTPSVPTNSSLETTFSYLDTVGRPTVRLQFKNLVDGHRHREVLIRYHYSVLSALRKPASVALAFALIFTLGVFLSKINLSVSRKR
jgi:oligosaccharyltransferase complex subunit alpha (ribophorin I)